MDTEVSRKSIQIPARLLFVTTDRVILKFIWKGEKARTILKRSELGGIAVSGTQAHSTSHSEADRVELRDTLRPVGSADSYTWTLTKVQKPFKGRRIAPSTAGVGRRELGHVTRGTFPETSRENQYTMVSRGLQNPCGDNYTYFHNVFTMGVELPSSTQTVYSGSHDCYNLDKSNNICLLMHFIINI